MKGIDCALQICPLCAALYE